MLGSLAAACLVAACASTGGHAGAGVSRHGPTTSTAPLLEQYLTGYAATVAAWGNSHTVDPDGTGFWPRLPNGKDTYQDIRTAGGRVVSYTENFDPPSNPQEARASVMNELPTDAKVLQQAQGASCEQLVLSSPTVLAVVHTDVLARLYGPPPGQVSSIEYSPFPAGAGDPKLPVAC